LHGRCKQCKVSVAEINREMPLKNRSPKFEDNIKVNFEEIMTEGVDLFHLAQDRTVVKGSCKHLNKS